MSDKTKLVSLAAKCFLNFRYGMGEHLDNSTIYIATTYPAENRLVAAIERLMGFLPQVLGIEGIYDISFISVPQNQLPKLISEFEISEQPCMTELRKALTENQRASLRFHAPSASAPAPVVA